MENPVYSLPGMVLSSGAGVGDFQQYQQQPANNFTNTNNSMAAGDGLARDGDSAGSFIMMSLPPNAGAVTALPGVPFAYLGATPVEMAFKAPAIPIYNRRFSVNELKARGISTTSNAAIAAAAKRTPTPVVKKVSSTVSPKKELKSAPTKAGQLQVKSPSPVESESESESDYSSDEYEEAPEPDVAKDSFLYPLGKRVIETVWSAYTRLDSKEIQEKLKNFNAVVQELQDGYTKAAEAETKAEKSGSDLDKKSARNQQEITQKKMRLILQMLVKHGHKDVVECVPQHLKLLVTLRQWLVNRVSSSDYNGPLSVQILRLFSNYMVIPDAQMTKIKLDKVLARYSKKGNGDDVTKPLAKRVLENSQSGTLNPLIEPKAEQKPSDEAAVKAERAKSPPAFAAGIKREREADSAGQAVKRQAVQGSSSKPPTMTSLVKPESKKADPLKKPTSSIATTTGNAVKTKTVTAPAKTQGVFSYLRTSTAPAKAPAPTTAQVAPTAPATTGGFSFAAAMASLNKKEETAAAVKAAPAPVESAEQKKKRLRREARGNMRVRFKPDSELEMVKLFTSDAAERAYRKIGGSLKNSDEGRALKDHNEAVEEEDEKENEEVSLRAWTAPMPLDFSDLDAHGNTAKIYLSRGGQLRPESTEKERIDAEHARHPPGEFFYENRSDLPSTPGEPAEGITAAPAPPTEFGQPSEAFLRYMNRAIDANPNPVNRYIRPVTPAWDLPADTQPEAPKQDFSALEAIFAKFSAKPAAPVIHPNSSTDDMLQQFIASTGIAPSTAPMPTMAMNSYLAQMTQAVQQPKFGSATNGAYPVQSGVPPPPPVDEDEDDYEPTLDIDPTPMDTRPDWQSKSDRHNDYDRRELSQDYSYNPKQYSSQARHPVRRDR